MRSPRAGRGCRSARSLNSPPTTPARRSSTAASTIRRSPRRSRSRPSARTTARTTSCGSAPRSAATSVPRSGSRRTMANPRCLSPPMAVTWRPRAQAMTPETGWVPAPRRSTRGSDRHRAALTRRPYRHLDGDRFIAEAVPVAVSACCSRAVRGVRIVFRFTEDTDSHVTERWPLQHWQDQMRVPSWRDAGLNRSPAA